MNDRCIAHVDMDAFFASIEIRDNPALTGRPVVVGGSSGSRGVVAAASYEARRYGIRSAMPMARAERLCPDLVRIPSSFEKYTDASRRIMSILHRFSPLVEPLSLDEAFLDLTGTEAALGPPGRVGRKIKDQIRREERLTASVGIAPVKFVAKIASDLEKPDGLVIVSPGSVEAFLRPLPISRLWGAGPRTREVLEGLGMRTMADIADTDPGRLASLLGEHGRRLAELARGIDDRPVAAAEEAKSYSHEETFPRDITDPAALESVLLGQAMRVSRRLRVDSACARVVQVKIRYCDFSTLTRRLTLEGSTADEARIFQAARVLFRTNWNGRPVRLIGLGVSRISREECSSPDLFGGPDADMRRRRLAETIDRIGDRFGEGKVTRARLVPEDPGNADAGFDFVSGPISPLAGTFDTSGMAGGAPGIPEGFVRNGRTTRITEILGGWKLARPEPGSGELYVRRHYYRLRMDDGDTWVVYCLRGSTGVRTSPHRWFLHKRGQS